MDHGDIQTNRIELTWELVRLRDGRTTRIADAGAPRWTDNGFVALETPQWAPDGAWVYFLKLSGEEVQLWRASPSGDRMEQVSHDASDVTAFIVGPDGRVHYAVGPATRDEIKAAEAVEADEGVLLDRSVLVGFPITHGFPVNGRMATVRRGPGVLGRTTLRGDTPVRAMSLDARLQKASPASPAISDQFRDLLASTEGGSHRFDPKSDERAESVLTHRIASLEASAGGLDSTPVTRSGERLTWRMDGMTAGETCLDPTCLDADHLGIIGWTADGRALVFETRTFETVRLNLWDVEANRISTAYQSEQVLGSDVSGVGGHCQLARGEAICIAAAADDPPRLVAIDLQTGHERRLFDPNPGLSLERLGVARKITLTDKSGSTTVGHLILPGDRDPRKRLPLVITSYTCRGFLFGGTGRDQPEHVLAGRGYAAICIDEGSDVVRRAAGAVATQANGQVSGLSFFENAISVLDAQAIIDPTRVMLTGFSGSSSDTTFAISHSHAFTAAAVTTNGSIDAIACYVSSQYRSCADMAERGGYAKPYDSRNGVLKESPAWNADNITAPLLMQLAEVEYVPMMQLYGAMLDYGRAVEMHIFPNAYHYKNQPRQRLAVYDRNVDWANFWLRGIESPDPQNAEQNKRWRSMRDNQCGLFAGNGVRGSPPWYCPS
jgi:dipeptidyl aminopeptidase/acylaminoacyl peptidase